MKTHCTTMRLAGLLVLLWAAGAKAQQLPPVLIGLSWQLSFPIGETHAYASDVSWRGIGLDLATFVRPDVAVGLAFGWNVFFENTTSTLQYKGVDITGNQDRTLNVWPVLANARYFPRLGEGHSDVQPYVGANIGGYIIERYLAIGLTAFQETHFHFGLAPEIGVFFQNPVGAVILNARYNMAFASGGVPFQQFLSINLGYAWEHRR
jgi:hypothetical protein